ncbi:MAG: PepSY domain-containing protein, partial [Sphingomonas sp.]
ARVTTMLAKRGYKVTKIEADDGHWEGEAARRGAQYEFHVDPHNGKVTKLERDRD